MKTEKTLENSTTMELAFGLATNQYSDADKFLVLAIINRRETGNTNTSTNKLISSRELDNIEQITNGRNDVKVVSFKKGSKSETINKLFNDGKSVTEIFTELNKGKLKTTNSEIYRIKKIRDNAE